MKSLSSTLLYNQKQSTREPALSLVSRAFGHPEKAGGSSGGAGDALYPGLFNWTRLYQTGSITATYHALAFAGDSSLNRIRATSGIYHQRIASPSPSSDFSAGWTLLYLSLANPCAIAANPIVGGEVAVVGQDNAFPAQTQYWLSGDYGASFSGPTTTSPPAAGCRRAIAACYKPNGDLGIVGSDTGTANLWFARKSGINWYGGAMSSPPDTYGLAIYYDGDWNIIALVNVYGTFKLARIVYGDGYRASAGVWSGIEYLNLGSAEVDSWDLQQNYYDKPPWERMRLPLPRQPGGRMSRFYGSGKGGSTRYGAQRRMLPLTGYSAYTGRLPQGASPEAWRNFNVAAIYKARAVDNLDLDAPFICKPSGDPPIISVYKTGDKWFWRLKPATDFYDAHWSRAFKERGECMYGLAIASDGTWLWGTRANEVWRSPLPLKAWTTPTAGSGAPPEAGSYTIAQADVVEAEETIRPFATSRLELTLDNSKGSYSSLPSTHIKKGARVEFACGYQAEYAPANYYFIEDWTYDRAPNQATVALHCIDAWGLLEKYSVPGYHEFNMMSNTHTVYALIEKVIQCIGGTLGYNSRSSDITTLYPKFEVRPGETGAGVLRRLLALVPDVIFFCGLDAYIVYPQATDTPTYSYYFPEGNQ